MMAFNFKFKKHNTAEKKNKVQFVTLFHLLKLGKPIINFESMHGFLQFLKVKNTTNKHWMDTSGWGMVECMNNVVSVVLKNNHLNSKLHFCKLWWSN
jgi:hypothetical protein